MRKSRRAYPFLIGAFLLAWFTTPVLQAEAQVVRVAGSGSMATMVDAWAQAFMTAQPGIKVIVSGGGTGTGFNAFFQKRAEIVMASCTASEDARTKAASLGIQLTQSEVGREAVAVLVHPMIGVEALTVEQLGEDIRGGIPYMEPGRRAQHAHGPNEPGISGERNSSLVPGQHTS